MSSDEAPEGAAYKAPKPVWAPPSDLGAAVPEDSLTTEERRLREERIMPTTHATLDLTDDEARYLLSLLYANEPGQSEDMSLWTSTRSKMAARLGKR